MPDHTRVYARQDHVTPGAAETVELIAHEVEGGMDLERRAVDAFLEYAEYAAFVAVRP